MSKKFRLHIIHSEGSFVLTSNGRASLYDLRRAVSKELDIPLSSLILRTGKSRRKLELPDSTLICNADMDFEEYIFVEDKANNLYSNSEKSAKSPFEQISDPDGMIMIRRVIPADNSCLFNAVAYAVENHSRCYAKYLREIVASYIASDPEVYNEAVLEMSNEDYQEWIMDDSNWGGAIETEILSRYFGVEICTVDTQTLVATEFGCNKGYDKKIYILYGGAHYDIIVRNISEDMDEETDITIFDPRDKYAYEGALMLAKEINYKAKQIEPEHFDLQCGSCSQKLLGKVEAQGHYEETGHVKFNEISS
jgi:ubiquitin thioesterase OTU1